jgi:hypothetical protein
MSKKNQFSAYELEQLAKLPPEIAALASYYPTDIMNAAEFWHEPPFPENYIPSLIEVYYGDTASSDIFILNGELRDYQIRNFDKSTPSIAVQIDDQWAYIQVEGKEILNRLGGVILPDVIVEPSILFSSLSRTKEEFKIQNSKFS